MTFTRSAPIALLFLTLLAGGCSNVAEVGAPPVTLRVSGSSAMQPVLLDLAAAYEQSHGNVTVEVSGGGSQLGMSAVEGGAADLAAVSWAPDAASLTPGYHLTPIARDALAILTNPKNPVSGLTLLQLRALYRGEVLEWAALGGTTDEPTIISREDGSGDRLAFEALVMGNERVSLNALMLPTAEAVAEYVAGHPAAVGYASMAQHRETIQAVPIEGLAPTPDIVRSGAYHLSRVLYLYAPARPSPRVRSFLDFVLSPAGQAIVARHHVVLN